jgi:AcrR family transcriptional regulator
MAMTTEHHRLTRQKYIDAAARFIDEYGEAAFTLRSLGAVLGVDQSAVYRHFKDRAAVVDAVQEWLFGLLVDQQPTPTGTPREQLISGIERMRRVLLAHPNLTILTGRGVGLPSEVVAARWVLDLLGQMGLNSHRRLVAYQMIESYVYGTSIYDCTGGHDAMKLRRQWYRQFNAVDTDAVARSTDTIAALTDEAFRAGLHALLDACEQMGDCRP